MAATPKVVTDGSSDLDESVLNKFVNGVKGQVKVNFCRILFTASTNVPTIVGLYTNDGEILTGDLAFTGNEIVVTLTGFSLRPIPVATIGDNNSTNVGDVLAYGTSLTDLRLRPIGTSGGETAVDPDGDIEINLLLIGN